MSVRNALEWAARPRVPSGHYLNSRIYTDPEIFEEETEKILKQTWKFACHESEIPKSGDYRTLNYAGTPLVVVRSDDGAIRTFVNVCSHRAMQVAQGRSGTAKVLTCPFHLWSYDTRGNCIEIIRPEGYDKAELKKEHCGLRQVKTSNVLGMVFINLNDTSPTLKEYIGDALETFEELMGTKELEVFHYHRVVMTANWKQWHETNMELYHEWGHVVNRTTSVMVEGYHDRTWKMYPNGHGTLQPFAVEYKNYPGWENRMEKTLPGLSPGEFRLVDLFPNTTLIARATALRIDTSTPISPGKTLVEYRGLGIKGESAEDREMRQRHHNQFWGPFGRNLAEDVIFVESAEESNRNGGSTYSLIARHEDLKSQDDEVLRSYYKTWRQYVGRDPGNPSNRTRREQRR